MKISKARNVEMEGAPKPPGSFRQPPFSGTDNRNSGGG
jgi:hypothetical protein